MLTPDDLRAIAEEPVNHTENDLEMVGPRCLADELRCNAEALRDGHTLRGEWHDDDARREHDKLIRWADAMNHTENDLEMVGLQCLADIRAAVGDSGQMMQSELVECIKRLRADAERYRWLRGDSCPDHSIRWARWEVRCYVSPVWSHDLRGEKLDAAIDAAMAKEAGE